MGHPEPSPCRAARSPLPRLCLLLFLGVVYLRLSQTVQIGDVKGVAAGGRVHAPRAPLLQPQVFQNLPEARVLDTTVENIKPHEGGTALLSAPSLVCPALPC